MKTWRERVARHVIPLHTFRHLPPPTPHQIAIYLNHVGEVLEQSHEAMMPSQPQRSIPQPREIVQQVCL